MADALLRQYKIPLDQLRDIYTEEGYLPRVTPEVHLARIMFDRGERVDVNDASYEDLIRVPGIGLKTAHTILRNRETHHIIKSTRDLRTLGVIVSRPFRSFLSRALLKIHWIRFLSARIQAANNTSIFLLARLVGKKPGETNPILKAFFFHRRFGSFPRLGIVQVFLK